MGGGSGGVIRIVSVGWDAGQVPCSHRLAPRLDLHLVPEAGGAGLQWCFILGMGTRRGRMKGSVGTARPQGTAGARGLYL